MCAAARIFDAVRRKAAENNPDSKGQFDSIHVRRGDFQFKMKRVSAEIIYNQIKEKILEGATLYIASDERDKSFFEPIKEKYKVYFLDDSKYLIKGMNTNYYEILDQLVASKGRTFFGTCYSKLTGYIMRMRGYASVENKADGYLEGALKSSFYIFPEHFRNVMTQYEGLKGNDWEREFPVSWHDID